MEVEVEGSHFAPVLLKDFCRDYPDHGEHEYTHTHTLTLTLTQTQLTQNMINHVFYIFQLQMVIQSHHSLFTS